MPILLAPRPRECSEQDSAKGSSGPTVWTSGAWSLERLLHEHTYYIIKHHDLTNFQYTDTMPKRTELVKQIRELAKQHGQRAEVVRQGSHEIWECAGLTFSIPRHREIAEGTTRAIMSGLTDHLERLTREGQ